MADEATTKDASELGLDETTETFDIDLFGGGDEQSGFHTKNDPSAPFQRTNVTNRKGAIDIKCNLVDVVHGKFDPDGDEYATLIVLLFRFDPRKRARRVAEAQISLVFDGLTEDDPRPVVEAISFDGRYSVAPTTQSESVTRGAEGTLGLSAIQGAELSGGLKVEKTVTRDMEHFTTVIGSVDLIGYNYGEPNCATWSLIENEARETGVPAAVRAGILLRRTEEEARFKATIKIEVKADFKTSMERFFGGKPKDDPVLFDPAKKPTNKLMVYDTEDLGALDLEKVSDVTFLTVRDGAVKKIGSTQ
ncbi:hypothetical protein D7B24_006183 [Verticillium nonalfalfae]|uniref:Uncharacterized protein n=1 Tax=Verticillium nonalfalfae TaxID=1051616 RepID=A0A3M9YBY0_9PEZI|nr:uncharacterized protein D7B24_006183 [Verticillium nonalfalfae]RNJ57276.1 hypothetical protein D7B24_006183 [Verticillium nonalfalfae]